MSFDIQMIRKGIYGITDEGDDSFYLVEGKDKAAVIDTGISKGQRILPVIRQLTDKPLLLVVTHAHIDHFHHMDEFEEVYMSHKEFLLSAQMLKFMMGGKELDLESTIDVTTNSTIDLGEDSLEICELAGHTPGGIIVLEKKQNILFTGDCLGSGCGVWMQVGSATSLDTFYDSLVQAFKWLVDRGGRMEFWGGHNKQVFMSKAVPGFNPFNLGLMADMIDLVDKVRNGSIRGEITEEGKAPSTKDKEELIRYAAYGRAEMLYIEEDIHNDRFLVF